VSRQTVARVIVEVLLIACVGLIVLGLQEARTGNMRPLILAFAVGAPGFFIVWFRSRRII
jgi:hypothetical protein